MHGIEMIFTPEQARILRHNLEGNEDPEIIKILSDLKNEIERSWNPNRDQQEKCSCSHAYGRHFDSYEDMYPIGCKYCECDTFEYPNEAK